MAITTSLMNDSSQRTLVPQESAITVAALNAHDSPKAVLERSYSDGSLVSLIDLEENRKALDLAETGTNIPTEVYQESDFNSVQEAKRSLIRDLCKYKEESETKRPRHGIRKRTECKCNRFIKEKVAPIELEMKQGLKYCVVQHQKIIKMTRELQLIFKEMLTLQVIYNALLGIIGIYVTTMGKKNDSKVVLVVACVLLCMTELLIFSWVAGKLTIESLEVREAAYACDWVESTGGLKSSLRIIMLRAQQPLYIRAAGIALSRKTFRAICRIAYYCNTIVSNVYHGEKINSSTQR